MKKAILLICLCLFYQPVFAKWDNNYCKIANNKTVSNNQGSDTEGADDFFNELILPEYGSDESPAFLNRENINPHEDSYNDNSPDASEVDSSDDDGNYEQP